MSNQNPILAVFNTVGNPERVWFSNDIDLCYQPSMSTFTQDWQRETIRILNDYTHGGVTMSTGRAMFSIDKTFGHLYPAVAEHGSQIRLPGNNTVLTLSAPADTELMAAEARRMMSGRIPTFEDPSEVHNIRQFAVFIEQKKTSIALVHTHIPDDQLKNPQYQEEWAAGRSMLLDFASVLLSHQSLDASHEVKAGEDAIEIVPRWLSHQSEIHNRIEIPKEAIEKLHGGLKKASALHVMQSYYSERDMTVVMGDSGGDFDAGVEAFKHFNGVLIPVLNGNELDRLHKDDDRAAAYRKAARFGAIDHYQMTYSLVADAVREHSGNRYTVVMPESGIPSNALN